MLGVKVISFGITDQLKDQPYAHTKKLNNSGDLSTINLNVYHDE